MRVLLVFIFLCCLGLLFSLGLVVGTVIDHEGPHWDCHAEDEVVVIDHTCRHIDTLVRP